MIKQNTIKQVRDLLKDYTYLKTCKVLQHSNVKDWYTIVENNDYQFIVTCSKKSGVLSVRTYHGDRVGRISFYQMDELLKLDKQLKELRGETL